jgi:hypothetical protein
MVQGYSKSLDTQCFEIHLAVHNAAAQKGSSAILDIMHEQRYTPDDSQKDAENNQNKSPNGQ